MPRKPVSCRTFVGRRGELAALEDARRALAASSGSLIVISGDAGIGKTRLLTQFLSRAREGRAKNIAVAECLARVQQPFGAVRSWARTLLASVDERDLPSNAVPALAQLLPDRVPSHDAAPLEKVELFVGLTAFFKAACAKRATILSVEDIHWADRSTLDFLEYVTPRLAGLRLLLIATYRSDELEQHSDLFDVLGRILRERCARSLHLEALSRSELRTFVQGALEGQSPLAPATIEDVELRSEGNPFFAEELLKSALDHRRSSNASLPLSIRASILQRVAALDEDGRRAISFGAALGYRFDPELLAAVLHRNVDDVLPALRNARDLNILVDEPAVRAQCRFRHALTRQTIYEDQGFGARRVHAQILSTLESLNDPDRHIQELAYHAWECHDSAKALRYNERAGDAAVRMRAFSEAAVCYERALRCAADSGDRARMLERTGAVAQLRGLLEQAIQAFETASALRLERQEYDEAAPSIGHIASERNNLGDVGAGDYAARFAERYRDKLSTAARDNLLVIAGRFACIGDRFEEADRLLREVKEPQALPPRVRQGYLIAQATRHSYFGELSAWKNDAAQLDDILPSLPPYLRLLALYTVAQTGTWIGANADVEKALAHAARLEAEWEYTGPAIYGAAVRSSYLYLRGRLPDARAEAERVLEHPDIRVAGIILAPIGLRLAAALQDAALERRCVDEQVVREARERPASSDAILLLGSHALTLAASGATSTAQRDLREALAGMTFPTPIYTIVLLAAALHMDAESFPAILRIVDRTPQRHDNLAGRAAQQLVRAVLAQRQGESSAGEDAMQAAELYESLQWPLFKAQALEIAGRTREALAIYAQCGACGSEQQGRNDLPRPAGGSMQAALSAREREISQLVSRGLTNTEIGERLALSAKTVEKHVSSIFVKLSVRSRAQLAAVVASNASVETPR